MTVLLEVSIYSAAIFAAILLLKKALGGRMSPRLHFALWFLLIIRLAVPVTIDSGFHFFTLPQERAGATGAVEQAPVQEDAAEGVADEAPQEGQQAQAREDAVRQNTAAKAEAAGMLPDVGWQDILLVVWLGGAALMAVRTGVIAMQLRRKLKGCTLESEGYFYDMLRGCRAELGVAADVPLYLSSDITMPALTMGFRPRIILPYQSLRQLDDEQVGFVMRHELTHYKRGDHLTGMLLKILEAVYWFNPIVWIAGRMITDDMEAACDNEVADGMDAGGKKRYAITLVRMFADEGKAALALGMSLNNQKVAEQRIRGIYKQPRSRAAVKACAVAAAAILFVACFTTACQPETAEEPLTALMGVSGEEPEEARELDGGGPYYQEIDASASDESSMYMQYENEFHLEAGELVKVPEETAHIFNNYVVETTTDEESLTTTAESFFREGMQANKPPVDYVEWAYYTTSFDSSAENRRYNIWKASDAINGIKIEPGEIFSFNGAVGDRTERNGWKDVPAIDDGEYTGAAGGGVDQVATTLYNAVIRAELPVEEHVPHMWPVDYAPGGLDAAVGTGAPDFKFRNNLSVPVYIMVNTGERELSVTVMRPRLEDKLLRNFESELVETFGSVSVDGQYEVYKVLKDEKNNEVSRELFSTVTYTRA